MLSAASFQITLLSGQNWQNDLELYVLGAVFLALSTVWYALFRLKPSVYTLSFPWLFFGFAFFLIGLPSVHPALHSVHDPLSSAATWCYAAAPAAAFAFFSLNFGEDLFEKISKVGKHHHRKHNDPFGGIQVYRSFRLDEGLRQSRCSSSSRGTFSSYRQ